VIIINRKLGLGLAVIAGISFALLSTATVGFAQTDFSVGNFSGSVTFVPDKLEPGLDFTVTITISNAENAPSANNIDVELYEDDTRIDNQTIDSLAAGENVNVLLSGMVRKEKKEIKVKISGTFVASRSIKTPTGTPLELLLTIGAAFLVVGIGLGYIAFGGRRQEAVLYRGPKPKVRDSEAHDAISGANDDIGRAGHILKEASRYDVDVSAEEELLKRAQEFGGRASKEYRDGRYDSAFAYADTTSALGSGIASALKARLEEARAVAGAKKKAEANIRAAEIAIKEVKSNIGGAESVGIYAKPATSLADLASEIVKTAGAAKDSETYRFQSATAKRIAEHAAASLKDSISRQKDQVKRTEEAIAGASDALSKAEARIGKERKNFDTLVPEYWLKVAKEVYSISEDKKLGAEVREAMADTSTKICEWIEDMFERRDIRVRMKKGKGITLR